MILFYFLAITTSVTFPALTVYSETPIPKRY